MTDGTLLRGEVLARWQEFVGTGEFFRQVETTVSRVPRPAHGRRSRASRRRPTTSARRCRAASPRCMSNAESRGVGDDDARAWRRLPGGGQLLQAHPDLARVSAEFDRTVARLVARLAGRRARPRPQRGQGPTHDARITAYGVNAIGTVLMLVTFASTGRDHRRRDRHRRRHRGARPEAARGDLRRPGRARDGQPRPTEACWTGPRPLYRAERERYHGSPRPRSTSRPDQAQHPGRRRGRGAGVRGEPACGWAGAKVAVVSAEEIVRAQAERARRRSGRRRRPAGRRRASPPPAVVAKVGRAHRPRGGPHRRRAGRGDRERQVLALQRAGRPGAWRTIGVRPSDHLDTDRGGLGRRPGRDLLDWLGVGARTSCTPCRPRSGEPTRRAGRARSTASCCSTCPTSTPARVGHRSRGRARAGARATCSCGSPTRRSTRTRGCTTTTSQQPDEARGRDAGRAQPGRPAAPESAVETVSSRPRSGCWSSTGSTAPRSSPTSVPHRGRTSTSCGSGWPTPSPGTRRHGSGSPPTSRRSPGALRRGRRRGRGVAGRRRRRPALDALSRASGVPVVLERGRRATTAGGARDAPGGSSPDGVATAASRPVAPAAARPGATSQVLEQVDPLDVREIVGRPLDPGALGIGARRRSTWPPARSTERAADGLPVLWAEAVSRAAAPTDDRSTRRLDRVVVTTLVARQPAPIWWRVMGWLQWVLGLRRRRRARLAGRARRDRLAQAARDRHPEARAVPAADAAVGGRARARRARRMAGARVWPGSVHDVGGSWSAPGCGPRSRTWRPTSSSSPVERCSTGTARPARAWTPRA